MDFSKLCACCFNNKNPGKICPHCRWQEGSPPDSPSFLPPRTILHGKYILGKVLGQGGFGITYLAMDIDLGIKLAIKEFFPREFASRSGGEFSVSVFSGSARTYFEEGLNKFLEEAKTLARLEGHPNIVSVRDFFRENGTAYLVMNFLDGSTLKEYLLTRSSRLDFQAAMQIILPVMEALKEIHRHGILHRDISPENIFITEKGLVKILDFGAARQVIGEHSKSLSIILKPGYAPEEQYRSKGRQGPWTDIYALSATIYRMLCGETPPEALDRINGEVLLPPSALGVQIPSACEAALLKGLEVRGENRFQNVAEFQAALLAGITSSKRYLDSSVPGSKSEHLVPSPSSESNSNQAPWYSRSKILVISLAISICLAIISAGVYFYFEDNNASSPSQSALSTSYTNASLSSNQTTSVPVGQAPEKVVRDFYDYMTARNYQAVSSLLGGEMLAHYSSQAFSLDDLSITGYKIIENLPLSSSQARISVEATFVDSAKNSFKVTDVFLVENQGGRWVIVQLMDEKY